VEPTGNPKEDALRQIVAQHQAAKVDGVMVDATTANAIVQVLDALNPEIKEKYLNSPIQIMAKLAMSEVKKRRTAKVIKEVKRLLAEAKLQGLHPLIDGMYQGNGTAPSAFSRVPAAVEVMEANPEVEEFKLALSIMREGKPVPYLPFGFEAKLAAALEKAGADPADVKEVSYFGSDEDDEYNPPGW
jgi:hypothetical protein